MSTLQVGKHPAKAIPGAAIGAASTGTEQIGVPCEFVDGPNKGMQITWYGYFSDSAIDRTFESLRTLGFKGDDLGDLSSLGSPDAPVVQLVLENEDYNGQTQVKVRWVNKLGGAAMKNAFDDSQRQSFAAR